MTSTLSRTHIHCIAPIGTNAIVATLLPVHRFPPGVTSGTPPMAGRPDRGILGGESYLNIHAVNNPVGVAWWRRRQKVALASGVVSAPLATSEGHWLRGRGPRQTTIGLGIDHFVTVITSVEATGAV
jgi:hypothetical protein